MRVANRLGVAVWDKSTNKLRRLQANGGSEIPSPPDNKELSTSNFESEVGEVFGEIGGEFPAKLGRRFSSFFRQGKSSEAFSTKTLLQISPSNFTTRFWVVAGPKDSKTCFLGTSVRSKGA